LPLEYSTDIRWRLSRNNAPATWRQTKSFSIWRSATTHRR